MNEPVSFEIAKLLKEVGFGELSQNWYSVEGGLYYDGEFDNSRGFIPVCECEAPTIAEVVMWLYEKYGVWIEIIETDLFSKFFFQIKRKDKIRLKDGDFNSPTEAYEAAIKYFLTEIIKP